MFNPHQSNDRLSVLSEDIQRKLAPIREDYPGMSTADHIFVLEIRTGFEQLMRLMKGIESSMLAIHLGYLQAEHLTERKPPQPGRQRKRPA